MTNAEHSQSRLEIAAKASHRACAVRAALGRYVPVEYHLTTGSADRRDRRAAADGVVAPTAIKLRLAQDEYRDQLPWSSEQ